MARFANFNRAVRAQTPDYARAVAIDDDIYQRKYDRNMELAKEGITAFGDWKGDRTTADVLRQGRDWIGDRLQPDAPAEAPPPSAVPAAPAAVATAPMPPVDVSETVTEAPGIRQAIEMAEKGNVFDMATQGAAPAADAAVDTATDSATDAVAKGIPLVAALRGGHQLSQGDIKGALGTGAKAALAATGPIGWAGAAGLGLMGV